MGQNVLDLKGAPEGSSRSVDAFIDSISTDGIPDIGFPWWLCLIECSRLVPNN